MPDRKKGEDVGLICEELGFLFGERTFPVSIDIGESISLEFFVLYICAFLYYE